MPVLHWQCQQQAAAAHGKAAVAVSFSSCQLLSGSKLAMASASFALSGPRVLLEHLAIVADGEGHHSAVAVARRLRHDQGEATAHVLAQLVGVRATRG